MKREIWLVAVFLVMTPTIRAGTVTFDPPSITIEAGTNSVSFLTEVIPERLTTFDTVNVLFGSLDGLDLSYLIDPDLIYVGLPPAPPADQGIYAFLTQGVGSDIAAGCNNYSYMPWTSVRLGTLTVDTSGLAAGDVRQIIVSPEHEAEVLGHHPPGFLSLLSSGYDIEPLYGSVTITVVPEPCVFVALLVACAAAGRRRRKGCDEA